MYLGGGYEQATEIIHVGYFKTNTSFFVFTEQKKGNKGKQSALVSAMREIWSDGIISDKQQETKRQYGKEMLYCINRTGGLV